MKTASNWPTTIMPARKPARAIRPQAEADEDRREHGQQARADQFLLGRAGADIDHAAVVGLLGAGPDFLVAELDAAFLDDQERGPADGADGHGAEQERHGAADQHADEHRRARRRSAGRPLSMNCGRGQLVDFLRRRRSPMTAMKLANSDTAAITAEPMAMPLVMALVVLPTASRSARIWRACL